MNFGKLFSRKQIYRKFELTALRQLVFRFQFSAGMFTNIASFGAKFAISRLEPDAGDGFVLPLQPE